MTTDEAAAHWFVRHDGGDLSPAEQAAFQQWISESSTNAEAFRRAGGIWDIFEHGSDDPHLAALRQAALQANPATPARWRLPAGAAIAASLAGIGFFLSYQAVIVRQETQEVPTRIAVTSTQSDHASEGRHLTRTGERRTIKLPDGSSVTLNTNSVISVEFADGARRIRLTRGQALFEVAKDASRAFVVEAAGRQITALGTVFEVRLDPGRMHVLLVEGRVVVDRVDTAPASGSIEATILKPGQELVAELGAAQHIETKDVSTELLWRDGYVEFNDVTLADAVAEINRYTRRPIMLKGDAAGSLRLSGVFKTGSPDRFAAIVSEVLPLKFHHTDAGRVELVASSD